MKPRSSPAVRAALLVTSTVAAIISVNALLFSGGVPDHSILQLDAADESARSPASGTDAPDDEVAIGAVSSIGEAPADSEARVNVAR